MTQEEMKEQMLLQLHEQYAENNNSGMSNIVSLIVGLFAAIGGFMYVFLNSSLLPYKEIGCSSEIGYSLTDVLICAVAVHIVLYIIILICMYQGFAQRKEQFIIYAIRKKYANLTEKDDVLPDSYTPFGKEGLKILQGLYGEFVKYAKIAMLFIIVCVFVSLCANCYHYNDGIPSCSLIIWGTIYGISIILSCRCICCKKSEFVNDYKGLSKEFNNRLCNEHTKCSCNSDNQQTNISAQSNSDVNIKVTTINQSTKTITIN